MKLRAKCVWGWLLCGVLALAGCRNVDLPNADQLNLADGGRKPDLALNFSDGMAVGTSALLTFTAESLVGISHVTVTCGGGGIELADWTAPPFQGQVDLSSCLPFGAPTDAGEGIVDLTLVATAFDQHGNQNPVTFHLRVDASLPVLTTDLPERIRPGRPLDFTLTSSVPLAATPSVTIAELPVEFPDAGSGRVFHGHLAQTPKLGIDALDGGAVTLDALQDVEHTVLVKADGVGLNGNHGKLTQQIQLTRVLWDKPLPAPLFTRPGTHEPQPVDAPTPIFQGLVVPVVGQLGTATDFNPVIFTADSGSATLIAPILDGGWLGKQLDEAGWVFALGDGQRGVHGTAFINPQDAGVAVMVGDGGVPVPWPTTRVGGQLCGLTPGNCQNQSATLNCMDHQGGFSSTEAGALGPALPDPWDGGVLETLAATSGGNAFFGGYEDCSNGSSTFAVSTPDGGFHIASGAFVDPSAGSCAYDHLFPVIPTGDGEFVLVSDWLCPSQYIPSVALIDELAQQVGSYSVRSPWYGDTKGILGTWGTEHDLMVLESSLSGTAVNLYPPDGGNPSPAAVVPGVYGYPSAPDNFDARYALPRDVVKGTDGVALLAGLGDYTVAVIRLGPDLSPRWVYRYPWFALPGSLHLYSYDEDGPLYLVDAFNQRVVAIER